METSYEAKFMNNWDENPGMALEKYSCWSIPENSCAPAAPAEDDQVDLIIKFNSKKTKKRFVANHGVTKFYPHLYCVCAPTSNTGFFIELRRAVEQKKLEFYFNAPLETSTLLPSLIPLCSPVDQCGLLTEIHQKLKITGAGTTGAVVDTGISIDHSHFKNASIKTICGALWIDSLKNPIDEYGHGQLMASTMAGYSNLSPGVAIHAQIISCKVSQGANYHTTERDVLEGVQMILDKTSTIDVMNISFATNSKLFGALLASELVKRRNEEKFSIAVAAGNPITGGVRRCRSPALNPFLITVGQHNVKYVTKKNGCLEEVKKGLILLAPSHMKGALDPSHHRFPEGSSQSTAYVSGVILLMRSVNRTLSPDQVKYVLFKTADKSGNHCIVDPYKAVSYARECVGRDVPIWSEENLDAMLQDEPCSTLPHKSDPPIVPEPINSRIAQIA